MGQQNGFGSGFILGSIIGGVVGGLLGTALVNRNEKNVIDQQSPTSARYPDLPDSPEMSLSSEEDIELARHSLEDKIAQLNLAIDDVKQQLSSVQSNTLEQE